MSFPNQSHKKGHFYNFEAPNEELLEESIQEINFQSEQTLLTKQLDDKKKENQCLNYISPDFQYSYQSYGQFIEDQVVYIDSPIQQNQIPSNPSNKIFIDDQKNKNRTNLYQMKDKKPLDIQTNWDFDKKYTKIKQGKAQQTKNLPKYLKTFIKNLLRQKITTNKLKKFEKILVEQFIEQSYSLTSMQILFGFKNLQNQIIQCKDSDNIRKFCLQYFSSSNFISGFFTGDMKFREKKNLIKYSQIARSIPINPIEVNSWK